VNEVSASPGAAARARPGFRDACRLMHVNTSERWPRGVLAVRQQAGT